MTTQTEANLVAKLKTKIKERSPSAFVVKLADRFTRGLPDLLVVAVTTMGRLVVLMIEAKTQVGRQSKLQALLQEKIDILDAASGGAISYRIVRSTEELEQLMESKGL